VIKESAEEITCREAESALKEGGKHHNFISIGCRKIFTGDRAPLQRDAIRKKVVRNKFVDFTFIYSEATPNRCTYSVHLSKFSKTWWDSVRAI
jgi:hypothetical protein